jgi:ABC-type dipeptide/oligopeptide/nickel transport system permease subunit
MAEITPQDLIGTDFAVREHRSLWGDAWLRLISSNTARIGMVIVTLFIVTTVLAHFFWAYNPKTDLNYALKLKPPNLFPTADIESIHPFGTDKLGRDIFTRVIHGGWNSLRVGLVAVGISLSVGGILGLVAGFYESMHVTTVERYFLKFLIGLLLGALAAWIAGQWLQMVLLALLGLISVRFDKLLSGSSAARTGLFAGLGLFTAGGLALLVNPYVAIICGLLGGLAGAILSMNLGGSLLSAIIMRVMDIILSFPGYLLAIAIVAFLGPGLEKGMIAIGVVGIPVYARLARSAVLSVIQKEYVLAAQSVGEGHGRILFRHITPNIMSPIIVQTTMGLANAILSAAALGFLGLGAIPPEPEWGAMLGDSYTFLTSGAWWAVTFPGVAIILSVIGFNLLGDGLRDALDPKLRI